MKKAHIKKVKPTTNTVKSVKTGTACIPKGDGGLTA